MVVGRVWIELLRRGGITYGFAFFGQLLTAGAGLLLVNVLAKEEFALFAVFTALLQAFVAQSDFGTSGAVGYFYRETSTWDGFKRIVLRAIARVRLQCFLLGGIVVLIFFLISPAIRGITALRTVDLLSLTLATACFAMVSSLQNIVLGVRGDVNIALRIDVAAALVRLALVGLMFMVNWLSAEAALMTTMLSTLVAFLLGRLQVPEVPLGFPREYDKNEQRKVFRYVLPLVPGFLYYSLQPSILIWISAIFGNVERVAEIGAISRIGQMIAFLGFGLNLLALPYLVSLRDEMKFRHSYVFIWIILLSISLVIFVALSSVRQEILLLLGPKYSSLDQEVVLVVGTALLNIAASYPVMVNRVRGWNKLEPLVTIAQFATQVALIAFLPLDSTAGILIVGLIYSLVSLLFTFGINIIGFVKPSYVVVSHANAEGMMKQQPPVLVEGKQ